MCCTFLAWMSERPWLACCCPAPALAYASSMYGGELFDRLIRRGAYTEDEARHTFRQVAQGLLYLHG